MIGVNCNRNLDSLRLGKSEIVLLPRGVQPAEREEFMPFEHSVVNTGIASRSNYYISQ